MNMTHTYTLLQLYTTVKRVYFGFLQLLFLKVIFLLLAAPAFL